MIDLDDAASLCPGLRAETAAPLAFRATIALQRHHEPGVELVGTVRGSDVREALSWRKRSAGLIEMEDLNRSTEEGAEALALALAGRHHRWRVKRRLQSRLAEGADWLMQSGAEQIVLEVGGTDEGDLQALYGRKVRQAQDARWSPRTPRAACVVRFVGPQILFWSSDGHR